MVIDGRKIASDILENLKKQGAPKVFLAAFLVGNDPNSESFLKQKEKFAKELGVDFRLYKFPEEITQDELRKEILKIAEYKTCGGAIVQLPLPAHISQQYVLNAIPREKDTDVLGERALGAFYAGRNPVLPPAVGVVEEILKVLNVELKIKSVAVIGRGVLVGKPVAVWLMDRAAELSVFTSKTGDTKDKLKTADIIVSGVGKASLFGAEDVKNEAIVIDFGYDKKDDKFCGDFDAANVPDSVNYTPTPGGTGPILVAKLLENFFKLNGLQK
ncbi:MAG: bifunctional 5,10-methylenetetrahydrofolate dehydrogenase/5,10-methenyltetrahydrofolate cyclohydrolase [Minisyncoccia bacterium]|jgi:methylenetetrahydrofolate dehydrogenase (NADP+)/methenyltetrahydrofolate cyclohydrolase